MAGQEPLAGDAGARAAPGWRGGGARPDDFDLSKVPDHLKMTFRVVDERGRKLAEDKDLEALELRLKPKTREAISKAAAGHGIEQRSGLTSVDGRHAAAHLRDAARRASR